MFFEGAYVPSLCNLYKSIGIAYLIVKRPVRATTTFLSMAEFVPDKVNVPFWDDPKVMPSGWNWIASLGPPNFPRSMSPARVFSGVARIPSALQVMVVGEVVPR